MSALRKQMQADVVLRGLAARTQESYIAAVVGLSRYYDRSPAKMSEGGGPALSAPSDRRAQTGMVQHQCGSLRVPVSLSRHAQAVRGPRGGSKHGTVGKRAVGTNHGATLNH